MTPEALVRVMDLDARTLEQMSMLERLTSQVEDLVKTHARMLDIAEENRKRIELLETQVAILRRTS